MLYVGHCHFGFCLDRMGICCKTSNPKYQNDPEHLEASANVKHALPYIMHSINDALKSGYNIRTKCRNRL